MEEIQRLLDEANGIMHEDLSTRLGNIVFTEGAGTSESTQTADIGQGVDFPERADTGQRAGCHGQVPTFPLCQTGSYVTFLKGAPVSLPILGRIRVSKIHQSSDILFL